MKDLMEETISNFLESADQELTLPFNSVMYYKDILTNLGYTEIEFETNGWQVDFWLSMEKDNKQIVLSGCLYCGGQFSLAKENE